MTPQTTFPQAGLTETIREDLIDSLPSRDANNIGVEHGGDNGSRGD
ncbi:hypothetical protein [Coleofasciculus sp.]